MDIFGTPPQYLEGLLGGQEVERLRKQSIGTGLLSAIIGGLQAAPMYRTQGLAPILGQALQSGMQGAQNVYGNAVQDYQTQQKIADMQRQQRQQKLQEESVAKIAQTNPDLANMLSAYPSAAPGVLEKLYTPQKPADLPTSVQEYNFAVKQGFQGTYQDWIDSQKKPESSTELDKLIAARNKYPQGSPEWNTYTARIGVLTTKAPPVSVNVSTEKGYGQALAGKVAEQDAALFDAANKAQGVLDTVQSTRNILQSGNVMTGFGANIKLDAARLGQALGVTGKDTNEVIANTQQLFANRAQATLDAVRASGLGSGQGFSNADREFLQKAKLGGIQFSAEALRRQLDIEEKVARATAGRWNERVKRIPQETRDALGIGEVQVNKVRVNY